MANSALSSAQVGSTRALLPEPRRVRILRTARVGLFAILLVFSVAYAIAQIPHTTWLRGSVFAVEEDMVGAIWPLAQSFDSAEGYGFTGNNSYPHLIQGDFGGTTFYPPGYPLLLWMTSKVVGDPHRASQFLNGAAALLFLGATYGLGLAWTKRRGVALLAAAFVASATVFLTLALAASTDLLAGALATAALALASWSMRQPERRRWTLFAAATLGLAFLVRRQTVVLLLPLLLVALASAPSRREAIVRAGGMVATFGLMVLPDLVIQYQLHGSPLASSHGKNLWNAIENRYDWPAWHTVPNSVSAMSVIASSPADFARNWLGNLLYYAERMWLGPATLLVLPGAFLLSRRSQLRPRTLAVLASAAFVVLVASASERGDRHALILVPVLAVAAAAALWYGLRQPWRLRASVAMLMLTVLVGAAHTRVMVADELQVPHLHQVVAALEADGADADDALTSFGSAHYAFYSGLEFEPLPGRVDDWSELRAFMERNGVRYFVARRENLHEHRLAESQEPSTAPSWLEPIWAGAEAPESDKVVVYRYDEG